MSDFPHRTWLTDSEAKDSAERPPPIGHEAREYMLVLRPNEMEEFPPRIEEAIGLLRQSEDHDENCGIPHPADPDQSSRCTCGLGSRVERAEELITAELEERAKWLEEAEDRFETCDECDGPAREEDLKVVWAREPESGEQVDARICRACRAEVERDQLTAAIAAHREVKLPGGIDWIDQRLYEDARRITGQEPPVTRTTLLVRVEAACKRGEIKTPAGNLDLNDYSTEELAAALMNGVLPDHPEGADRG